MADLAFKLASLAGFYADLDAFTTQFSYARLTDAVTGAIPGDPGTVGDFIATVERDATRLDFIHVANLESKPPVYAADGVTVVTPAVMSGPHLDIRASFVDGLGPSAADQTKMTTLLGQLGAFFGAQAAATFTPDPAVQSAYGVGPRQYPRTVNGTWVILPAPLVSKFGV
jgi:hypothetical protein